MALKFTGGKAQSTGSPMDLMQPMNEFSGTGRAAKAAVGKLGVAHARLKAAALREGDAGLVAAVRQAEMNLDTAIHNLNLAVQSIEKFME